MPNKQFEGQATVRVNFRNRPEYEKFRKYVLKTEWSYALDYPLFEEMVFKFSYSSDIDKINRMIVGLLQMGFDVYCCRYELNEPSFISDSEETDDIPVLEDNDIQKIVDDMWRDFVVKGKVRN